MSQEAFQLIALGASVALSVAIAIQVWRDREIDARLRLPIIGAALAGACHAALVSQLDWQDLPRALARGFACAGVPLVWLIVQLVFKDGFKVGRGHGAMVVAMGVAGVLPLAGAPFARAALMFVIIVVGALSIDALRLLVGGWAADLDSRRRGIRLLLAAVAPAIVLIVVAAHLAFGRDGRPAWIDGLLVCLSIGVKVVWLTLTLGSASLHALLRTPPSPTPVTEPVAPIRRSSLADGSTDAERIIAIMTEKHLYRRPRLQLRELANEIGVPEYRVRQAIIDELGYRNFPAFVGRFRLQEIAARLRLAEDAHLPILTLAMDAGFASIGPFNRAFRDAYGVTPNQYRAGRPPVSSHA